jgi:hypothetical protein
MPREKALTKKRRRLFLEQLGKNGNVSACAESIGVSRVWLYYKRKHDPEFAEQWEDAEARFNDTVAAIEARRATIGEPVKTKRTVVETDEHGTITKTTVTEEERLHISDKCLVHMLDRRHPEFRAAAARREHIGPGGKPIAFEIAEDATEEEAARAYLELVSGK